MRNQRIIVLAASFALAFGCVANPGDGDDVVGDPAGSTADDMRTGTTVQSATAAPSSLMFYKSDTAANATALFASDGSFNSVATTLGLSPGFTHVEEGGAHHVVFYNANTGALATGRLSHSGVYTDLKHTTVCAGWTNLAITPDDFVLFYNRGASGCVGNNYSIGTLSDDGTFHDVAPGFATQLQGYTNLTVTSSGTFLFYNSAFGSYTVAQIDPFFGGLTLMPVQLGLSTGWTHIVAGVNSNLLFYNASNGTTAIGRVASNGTITSGLGPQLSTGWTSIVASSTNEAVLFYKRGTDLGAIGRLTSAGNYSHVMPLNQLSTGWTHIVAE